MSDVKKPRRTWTRDEKVAIVGEIGIDGRSLFDIAQKHRVDRALLKHWVGKYGARSESSGACADFVPVVVCDPAVTADALIVIGFSNGRSVKLPGSLRDDEIRRFVTLLEAT